MLDTLFNFFDQYSKILILIFTGLGFALLYLLNTKKIKFTFRVLIAMALGLVLGAIFQDKTIVVKPIGDMYVNLIKLIVIPLVFVSIIKSFTSLDNLQQVKKIGLKSVFWLLSTTAVAATIGLALAKLFNVGKGFTIPDGLSYTPKTFDPAILVNIKNLIPSNIASDIAKGNVVGIIIIALLVSIAIISERTKKAENMKNVTDSINAWHSIIIRVTKMIIKLTPYAVFILVAHATGRNTFDTLKSLALYIFVSYLAMLVHFIIVQVGLVTFVARINPIRYFSKIFPAQIVAFTTQSSYGTLPVTIKSLVNRVGVSERIANFTAPLGTNIGMNACGGIFPAIVAIFVANAFGIELTVTQYILIVFTATIGSIGLAGVPAIAQVAATFVLTGVNLPVEGIALILGIDALIDMGRTAINVTGATIATTLVAKSENELNYEILNSNASVDVSL